MDPARVRGVLGSLLVVAASASGCATIGPDVSTPEVEAFERVLRARSTRYFIGQNLRVQIVGTRLLRALPASDRTESTPYLGILTEEATDVLAETFDVPKREGVLILAVIPDGPADRAGVRASDYLEQVGSRMIATSRDLDDLRELPLAGPTRVVVRRGDADVETSVDVERLPWSIEFKVVENDAVDAFATPESITITTGMLRFLRSDDELAIVMGHELAHITRRHTLGRVALTVPPLVLGIIASFVVPGSQRLVSSFVERVVANILRVAVSKVDRDIEREADIYGLVYAHAAGYDPRAGGEVWERFAVELPRSMTAALFAVHPPSSERLLRVQKITRALLDGVPASEVLAEIPSAEDSTAVVAGPASETLSSP